MKRVFWILAFTLVLSGKAFSQEDGDDFFEDDEPPMESDFEYQAPPTAPVGNPEDPVPGPRPGAGRFGRPSSPPSFSPPTRSSSFGSSDENVEFKLVDPPEYKTAKRKLNVPAKVRPKVEENVRRAEKLRADDK